MLKTMKAGDGAHWYSSCLVCVRPWWYPPPQQSKYKIKIMKVARKVLAPNLILKCLYFRIICCSRNIYHVALFDIG
jgi:hypothetical protein